MNLRNKEDDYLTEKQNGKDDIGLTREEEEMIGNCNVKEKLILKLEDLDNKIFMLL